VKNKMVSFIGTDMHHQGHLDMTKKFATSIKFHKMMNELELRNKTL
jgi:hypothetical protein